MKKTSVFKIGDVYGSYTIIDSSIIREIINNKYYYKIKVKCVCGTEKFVDTYALKNNKCTRCFKCNKQSTVNNINWTGTTLVPGKTLSRIKRSAKARNIPVSISLQDIHDKLVMQEYKCILSKKTISFLDNTASVDRINSNIGYSISNIQIVHKDINIMKNMYDQEYFIHICNLISLNHKSNVYLNSNIFGNGINKHDVQPI